MRAIEATVPLPLGPAEDAVRAALAAEGFGILTEIDVAAVLKARLDVDRPPLRILGACNPTLAHRALAADPTAALVLPCNVVLEPDPAGGTRVRAVDPRDLIADPTLAPLAEEATTKLTAALAAASGDGS